MLQHCILPRFIHDRIVTFVIQRIGFVLTMEWIADPSIWAGLITLIVIELVLGIDNTVFIAILAENYRRSSVTAHGLPGCCWQC